MVILNMATGVAIPDTMTLVIRILEQWMATGIDRTPSMPGLRDYHLVKLSELLPGFTDYWHSNACSNGSDDATHTLSGIYSDASRLFAGHLSTLDPQRVRAVLDFIEEVLTVGSQEERDAVATCFLENVLNRTPGTVRPADWIPYLGSQSKAFCRAWDEFTGCRTEFLWDDPA